MNLTFDYTLVNPLDVYGRRWDVLSVHDRCYTCGQPDNCGDCTHTPLTDDEVRELGGILPNKKR